MKKRTETLNQTATFFKNETLNTAFVCVQSPVAILAPLTEESLEKLCSDRFFELLLPKCSNQRAHDSLDGARYEQRHSKDNLVILEVKYASTELDTKSIAKQQIKALYFGDNFDNYCHNIQKSQPNEQASTQTLNI